MLSTLSSMLPAALAEKLDKLELLHGNESGAKDKPDEQGVKRRDMADEGNKKEKKKKASSNETFIVVRPPPAKSNHPLNLQLQLVPAHHSRDRSSTSAATTPTNSRFSVDFTQGNEVVPPAGQPPPSPGASESGQGLMRSSSVRSNRSDTSAFYSSSAASSGSVTSFASTGSTSSGRRMIIPLYNLSAHNVMTNTVLDAGTDAKVAKFGKRGIEIMGLAILEPTEVWNGTGRDHVNALGLPIHRSISGTSSLAPPGQTGSRAATPEPSHSPVSSKLSLSSDHSSSHGHSVANPATSTAPTSTGPKKLFGRMFRKKEGSTGGGHSPSASVTLSTSDAAPAAPTPIPEPRAPPAPKHTPAPEVFLPAVLGLSPTLSGGPNPPTGRCISYVWIVRKWLKVENQGLISGVLGKIGREASAHGIGHVGELDPGEWEVRFEWERSKSKGEKARRAARRRSTEAGAKRHSQTPSRRNSQLVSPEDAQLSHQANDGVAISIDSPRQSLDVARARPGSRTPSPRRPHASPAAKAISVSSTTPSDEDGAPGVTVDDAGNESDPEDSETPWTCSMILTHPSHPAAHLSPPTASSAFAKGHSRTRTVSSSGIALGPSTPTPASVAHTPMSESGHGALVPTPIKVKVATLAPAPHHPKVVCQLKIPFPLADVEVHQGILRKRLVLPDGSTRTTIPREQVGVQPLLMTAEEIKDVVCSTAFWLVVREGFGGLGKKNRKGDGWKIRG